ncbi:Osmolarity sensor protein EnvZ [Hartmannibacter diazotrophicus]|uniref:histidine kinase n=1 Tax=Hartmannibacter diazotrophicus TaxID=1482074 RepID=A0A2C9D038_9HYPH|nr:HAMP domain-containing sensor histidine kinase [Hartmannibacter diazotrophicus]SON53593.1 Osmolarity sensor protein EnvZ [Hartmannibacter diazotrophicus]
MNRLLARIPALQRIAVQIALLVTLSIVVTNILVILSVIFFNHFRGPPPVRGSEEDILAFVTRIVTTSAMVAETPVDQQDEMIALVLRAVPHVRPLAEKPDVEPHGLDDKSHEVMLIPSVLRDRLPANIDFRLLPPTRTGSRYPDVAVGFADGQYLLFSHSGVDVPEPPPPVIVLVFGAVAIVLTTGLLLLLMKRTVIAPLERLSARVATVEGSLDGPDFVGEGTREVRQLAHELNGLRDRQKVMIRARTEMLAAVGHDLRTPLTRLRLRSETIANDVTRSEMIEEIDRLARLTEKALAFLRGNSVAEPFERVDVASLLSSLADTYAEMGLELDCDLPARLVASVQPEALTRCVGNLVENGFKFGTNVGLSLRPDEENQRIIIEIHDDGPGIEENLREQLMKPFVRADDKDGRGDRRGGFGLGLAIALQVTTDHKGALELRNVEPHGLLCCLRLPIEQRPIDPAPEADRA